MKPKILTYALSETAQPEILNRGCEDGGGACSRAISFTGGNVVPTVSLKEKLLVRNDDHTRHTFVDTDHYAVLNYGKTPSFFVLNTPAQEILDFFSQPRDPAEWSRTSSIDFYDAQLAIAQFYEAGLLQEVSAQPQIINFNQIASPLESWLYLTRACNLACAHCFVSKDMRRMSLETGLQAVDRLFDLAEKHGHPEVKIKYAGGEPTMNWELIPALHERAKSRAQETGLRLNEVLVTNATLLNRERLQFIKDERFRLSISLDGFGEGHDRQRPVRNGNPTFERVLQSVLLALEADSNPT